jgi:hypothetical protein
MDLAALKKKTGPLPMWAWALVVGLILSLIMFYLRGKSKINATPNPSATVSTDPYAAFENYAAAPTTQPTADQGPSGTYETNQSWMAKAIAFLTTKGIQPLDAQAALNNYLNNGGALSYGDSQIVNQALSQFGLPPDGVYGSPSASPKPNPTVVRYIRSSNGSIAAVFNDNTKAEFTSMAQYTSFSARHPAGALQGVSPEEYATYPVSQTNPSW